VRGRQRLRGKGVAWVLAKKGRTREEVDQVVKGVRFDTFTDETTERPVLNIDGGTAWDKKKENGSQIHSTASFGGTVQF